MEKGPRFITAAEALGDIAVQSITVTLTDAQIKASTAGIVIIPSTETLNYEGFPTRLSLPIRAYLDFNALGGAYTIIGDPGAYLFWSTGLDVQLTGTPAHVISQNAERLVLDFGVAGFGSIEDGDLFDNALVFQLAATSISDGNADNTLTVTVYYTSIDL